MLQFQDNDQDIPSTENSLFLPQSIINTVCNDLNINEAEGMCLQGNVHHEKEFNFGPLQCSCSSLPTSFSDSNWNIGYQFGANQFTPSPCCLFEQQTKKQAECALPPMLSEIEPFIGKETEHKYVDYGIISGKQGPSNTSGDCRLLSCMQSQQALNISMYNSFPTQDSSLLPFNTGNTNSYNVCLDSDCLDKICSPSRNHYSSCILDQNLDFNTLRAESIGQVICHDKLDLSTFMPMNNDEETILNVNESDEDSEIIVEDSDTESEVSIDVGPYMQDKDKDQTKKAVMRCFVCNLSYSEKLDFVQVNSSFPLTFISQTPVMLKLIEIIPIDMQTSVKFENNLICKRCLNLIDMIENLEVRLVSFKKAICDFVSRSSKDTSDEDWSLLQENNNICIDDNMEPLISKEVRPTEVDVENKEMVEIFNRNKKNVNDDEINKTVTSSIDNEHSHQHMKDNVGNKENTTEVREDNGDIEVLSEPAISNCNDKLSSEINSSRNTEFNDNKLSIGFKHQCDRCGKLYRREKELVFHLKKHMGEFLEKCSECGKGFMKKSNLEIHLRKHRTHICLNCRASFLSDVELSDHSKLCTEKKFTCSQCKLVFSSTLKLENHLEKHKVSTNKCSICNKSFKHPSYLVAHMISHSDKKPFTCEKCGKSYKNQNHLKRHSKTHSGLTCHICHKVFSFPDQLKSHLSIHAEEEECEICKKKFSKKYMIQHKKTHKNTTKRKECPICKKLLTTRLKVHMAKHSETKQYKCEICSVEFTFKHSLTKHMRLKHSIS